MPDDVPPYVVAALGETRLATMGKLALDQDPDAGWTDAFEKERRQIYLALLMKIVAYYWNGNKFGSRGTYYARDDQVDRSVRVTSGNSYVYRAAGEAYRERYRDLGDVYLGHNIAALAVNDRGRPIDFEMNHNAIFDSSMEHAEARLVRRIISLAQSYEAYVWVPPVQREGGSPGAIELDAVLSSSAASALQPPQPGGQPPRREDEDSHRNQRRSNLEGVTIYTSLEPCAQCAGIMGLANVREVVYLQRDPGMYCISNLLYNVSKMSRVRAFNPPKPITANVFEGDVSYFDCLDRAFKRFQSAVNEEQPFYVPPSGRPNSTPSITSFLCTDEAFSIFRHGGGGLDSMQLREVAAAKASEPPMIPSGDRLTNAQVQQVAQTFFDDYVAIRGRRGIAHLM